MSSAALVPLGNSVPRQDVGNLDPYRHDKGVNSSVSKHLQLSNEQEAHASALQTKLDPINGWRFIDNSSMAIGLSTLQTIKT